LAQALKCAGMVMVITPSISKIIARNAFMFRSI
jgi:3-isopropylmalate dehydratase small subunit